jgi:hypothetical protein
LATVPKAEPLPPQLPFSRLAVLDIIWRCLTEISEVAGPGCDADVGAKGRELHGLGPEFRSHTQGRMTPKKGEKRMPYFVKWTIAGRDEVLEQPMAYVSLSDAMDFACFVLDRSPTDIWVEDENGETRAMDFKIKQHCIGKQHR